MKSDTEIKQQILAEQEAEKQAKLNAEIARRSNHAEETEAAHAEIRAAQDAVAAFRKKARPMSPAEIDAQSVALKDVWGAYAFEGQMVEERVRQAHAVLERLQKAPHVGHISMSADHPHD